MNGTPQSDPVRENKKEACATFIEQTKQLISLASAFIIAPAVVQAMLQLKMDARFFFAEISFILSVLSSYVVLGSIAGSQFNGEFDIYRPATRVFALIQFFSYIAGLVFFTLWIASKTTAP